MNKKTLLATLSILALGANFATAKTGWTDDYKKGLEKAKTEKKVALLDFTGSDWCGWCIKLDEEVFSKKPFKDYAKENLVLVELDFPQTKRLPKKQQEQNEELAKKFNVKGYPTVVVVDGDGQEIGRLGYMEGGPDAFIAKLNSITKKSN